MKWQELNHNLPREALASLSKVKPEILSERLKTLSVLEENGFSLDRVEKIAPTMEDVFVSLIETRDQAGKNHGEGWK